MNGIEPQTVEPVLAKPLDRTGDEIGSHVRPVEIDRRAPWRVTSDAEELRRISMQVAAIRAEMVEHDVEMDGEAKLMRPVHQPLQVVGRPISCGRREGQDAVISP